jgi:predicted nucleotide-binding protein (sugar kinase/HSP70/actin superfamily)
VPGPRGKIGIPLCLNLYELLPFWHTFFTKLGFAVVHSPLSSRDLYLAGQATIPSDTACFPAKLMPTAISGAQEMHLDAIFYPCMTYNFDEGLGDNHYNCPVVAYYPEVLAGNCPELRGPKFIYDYVGIHRPKDFVERWRILPKYFSGISRRGAAPRRTPPTPNTSTIWRRSAPKGAEIIAEARAEGPHHRAGGPALPRGPGDQPRHRPPDHPPRRRRRHGGQRQLARKKFPTTVLNQWTYHSRLYAAARYCTTQPDMDLVQLVSFGCGVDAITTDETREILQAGGKLYTQLKIDEITNLGAVNIRLRSLFAALDERDEAGEKKD